MARDDRNYIVIANRWAGTGEASDLVGAVERAMGHAPAALVELNTTAAFREALGSALGQATTSSEAPLIVCVGGDGTLSLTLNAMSDPSAVSIAVVPCGSGNDLARMLGFTSTAAGLFALRGGAERRIDYGTVNGRRFLNCVGIGLDAEVAAIAARIRERGIARGLSYYLAALRGLMIVKPVGAHVRTPLSEERFRDLVMLTIGNGKWYGGGFRGAPEAAIDDGVFDCYAFRDVPGLPARFALMQRIRAGTHGRRPNVRMLRTDRIAVTFDREIAMHVDGELARCTSADIAIVPRGARVLAPSGALLD